MNPRLTLRQALSPMLARVQAELRYGEIDRDGNDLRVFAVFDDERLLGLVSEKQAMLFPSRIFADLVVLRQPRALAEDTPLEQAIDRLEESRSDFLPVQDADGKFLGVITRASLFGALAKSEHTLNEERASLIRQLQAELGNRRIATSVFETTSEGIVVTDAQAYIILVNRAFTETTGYTPDEVRGQTPHLFSSGHHKRDFYENMWASITQTGAWSGEIWNRRKNGEIYPEWLHINAIRDDAGNVTHHVGVFSDISQHKTVQKRLHDLAYYDALTHLPNRQLFYERLEQAVAIADRDRRGFTLLFLDFDRFKEINDSLGHRFGDQLLVEAAQRLRSLIRTTDTVARWGGDEFILILQEPEGAWKAAPVARKIIHAFDSPVRFNGNETYISASIGIARYPDDGDSMELLVSNADAAMYRAKGNGRACYSFYTPELNKHLVEHLKLENALRTCLHEGGLTLAWQPQFRLADGLLTGVEVLTRCHHSGLGDIPPVKFIPIAEESGLIFELGQWVLNEAASHAAQLCNCGTPPEGLRVAVNISPLQMRNRDLAQEFIEPLMKHGLTPACIELEITESALMSKEFSAEDGLQKLSDLGMHFAIDDFGTGYSNLAYLKRFAVHRLKIDRAFIQEIAESETDRQIVAAIISMGHSLGLKLVAEGVETEAQKNILMQLECDEVQGFLFGRPLPFDEFVKLLPAHENPCKSH